MADKNEDRPVQHTPKHLVDGDVFDRRHPAAKSYAVMQPAAGVVADDVEEKGQNLAGGPTESEAHKANMDQREILAQNYERDLREKAGQATVDVPEVDGDHVKAVPARPTAKADAAKAEPKPEDQK